MVQNLYNFKATNMIIMGLPPIGCSPHYLWQFGSQNGECIEEINDMIRDFNFVMRNTVEELRKKLRNSNLLFCDVLEGAMDILKRPESFGERHLCLCCSLFCPVNLLLVFLSGFFFVQVSMLLLKLVVVLESTEVG